MTWMLPIGAKQLDYRRRSYSDDATGRAAVSVTSTGTLTGAALPAKPEQQTEYELDGKRRRTQWLLYTRLTEPELAPVDDQAPSAGDEVQIDGRWCLVVRRITFGDQLGAGPIIRHRKYELVEVYP